MKAALIYAPRDIRVEEVETPRPGPGEVVLRVRACGICGSDLHEYKLGKFPEVGIPAGVGRIMGHEYSGEIAEMGEGVQGLKIGDRVIAISYGANAEYVKISARTRPLVLPIPDSLSFEEAATNEPLATSLHGVNLAAPQDNETIVIMGCGLIGLGALQILKATSKARVVSVDVSEKRLDMAKKIGADVMVNAAKEDPYQSMLKLTGSTQVEFLDYPLSGVDTVIDCAGYSAENTAQPPLWQALLMVKQNGKVVVVAVFEKPCELDMNVIMRKNIYLTGSWAWNPMEFFQAFELMKSGKVNRKPLITHTFPLEKAKQAYETQLNTREAIKVMITP